MHIHRPQVTLNVGGTLFTTSRETLLHADKGSPLEILFCRRERKQSVDAGASDASYAHGNLTMFFLFVCLFTTLRYVSRPFRLAVLAVVDRAAGSPP